MKYFDRSFLPMIKRCINDHTSLLNDLDKSNASLEKSKQARKAAETDTKLAKKAKDVAENESNRLKKELETVKAEKDNDHKSIEEKIQRAVEIAVENEKENFKKEKTKLQGLM